MFPTLIILAAAACVVLASLLLADTQWAAGVRAGYTAEEGAADVPTVAIYILPLVKVAVLMGIGGLATSIGSRVVRRVSR